MTWKRAAILLALVGCKKHSNPPANDIALTAAQQQELTATITASRAHLADDDKQWRAAIDAIDPTTITDGACPTFGYVTSRLRGNPQSDWSGWSVTQPLDFNGGSSASFSQSPFPITFLKVGAPIPEHSPLAVAYLRDLNELEHGGRAHQTFEARKQLATKDSFTARDVLARVDRVVEPTLGTHDHYTPGEVEISAWLYDHTTKKVVCAGVITAQSSPSVDPGYTNLNDDLMINWMRALPPGLHATK